MSDVQASDFNEQYFPVPKHLEAKRSERELQGRLEMARKKVVICGLARNIADVLPATISRIERLGSLFHDYRVVVYENDSTDATRLLLSQWARLNKKVTVIGHILGDPVHPGTRCLQRAGRMAHYRNELRRNVLLQFEDFTKTVIVIDMDLAGGWSNSGLATTFSYHDTWDFVGSNSIVFGDDGIPYYYDVWAYREFGSDLPRRPGLLLSRWYNGETMFAVNSCFGGLGVYRMEAFSLAAYDGSDCEHVPFHRKMRENGLGRLYLNPSQITHYGGKPSHLS